MNPHAPAPTSLLSLLKSLRTNFDLIVQMTRRDVIGRYKGSMMGLLWSFANPVFLLAIYTFVFSFVFNARWGGGVSEGKMHFALVLFVGMIVHGLFSETLLRAPTLVVSNVNYVKKIVFPLETLPVVAMTSSIFHTLINLVVLISAVVIVNGGIEWTVLLLPFILLPLIVLTLGLAWIFASLGVFFRDVAQPMSLVMTLLLFGSPVFYPLTALPEGVRSWLLLNPLTFIIEQARAVTILGQVPDFFGLMIYFVISVLIAWLGYSWFQKTKKGFANVL